MRRLLIAALTFWLGLSSAFAGSMSLLGAGKASGGGGGGGISLVGPTSGANEACGFPTSACNITGLSVTSGFVVVGISGNISGFTVTSATLCGTSLTSIVSPGAIGTQFDVELWAGTVTGGTCTLAVTPSTGFAFSTVYTSLVTVTGLSSTTVTSTCSNTANPAGASLACSAALTVPASGVAVGFCGQFNTATADTFSNLTTQTQSSGTTNGVTVLASNTTAGSLTPSCNTTANPGGVVAGTWH